MFKGGCRTRNPSYATLFGSHLTQANVFGVRRSKNGVTLTTNNSRCG